jgi:hypothetical protein
MRDPHSPLFARQPFRFGGLVAAEALFGAKGEAGAATDGFAAFGLRASLLPRRWDLAIFFSFGGVRRRRPHHASLRARRLPRRPKNDLAPEFTCQSKYSPARIRACQPIHNM